MRIIAPQSPYLHIFEVFDQSNHLFFDRISSLHHLAAMIRKIIDIFDVSKVFSNWSLVFDVRKEFWWSQSPKVISN